MSRHRYDIRSLSHMFELPRFLVDAGKLESGL